MQRRPAYEHLSYRYVTIRSESEQPVGVPTILGVGRLREDQFIYVKTRENVFFIIWDL